MDDFQNLANIAAVFGFGLSVINAVSMAASSMQRFKIRVIDYDDTGVSVRFMLCIDNRSARPLTITGVTFRKVLCELEPKKIRNAPESWNFVATPRFPIRVSARSSVAVYLEFVGCARNQLHQRKAVTFQIRTTFRQVRKTVLLGSKSHYLHIAR